MGLLCVAESSYIRVWTFCTRVRDCDQLSLITLCALKTRKAVEWVDRFVILTDQNLIIKNDVNGDIRDVLSLLDITHVKKMAEDAAFRHVASIIRCHHRGTALFPLACSE